MVVNTYNYEVTSMETIDSFVQEMIQKLGSCNTLFLQPGFGVENCSDGNEQYEIVCLNDAADGYWRRDCEYITRDVAYYLHDTYGVHINQYSRDEDDLVQMRDSGYITQVEFMNIMRERGYIGEYD